MQPSRPSLTLRKPAAAASPEAIAAFVDASEPQNNGPQIATANPPLRAVPAPPSPANTRTLPRADVPTFRRASRAIIERRTKPSRRRTTVYLDVELAAQLAQVLADRDQELSDAVNDAVRNWLAR
jgi:hypothetical protein